MVARLQPVAACMALQLAGLRHEAMPALRATSSMRPRAKCGGCDLSWVLPKLVIEVWMVVCIHAAFENLSILGSVKKPSCNPQRGYAITASPSFTYVAAL